MNKMVKMIKIDSLHGEALAQERRTRRCGPFLPPGR